MKIESILKRHGGTTVDLGHATYHFAPESGNHDDPHVCDVEDEDDLAKLLAIPEGFRLARAAAARAAAPAAPPPRTVIPPTSEANTMPVAGAKAGDVQPSEAAAPAAAAAKPKKAAAKPKATKAAAAPEEGDAPASDALPEDHPTKNPGDDDADQVREELNELDNDELEDEYHRVFGHAVPDEMDRAAMIEAIATKPAEG